MEFCFVKLVRCFHFLLNIEYIDIQGITETHTTGDFLFTVYKNQCPENPGRSM